MRKELQVLLDKVFALQQSARNQIEPQILIMR